MQRCCYKCFIESKICTLQFKSECP